MRLQLHREHDTMCSRSEAISSIRENHQVAHGFRGVPSAMLQMIQYRSSDVPNAYHAVMYRTSAHWYMLCAANVAC